MQCPFLRESLVRQCLCSAVKKMIPRTLTPAAQELCSSPSYLACPSYCGQPWEGEVRTACPYLDESAVQYCAAAPVVKLVPYSVSILSRCGSERHHYCDLYLALTSRGRETSDVWVDDIRMPARLSYAPNHMWMDCGMTGIWHIGIDSFLAKVLHTVDRISFVTQSGNARPTLVLTVGDADLPLTFPYPLQITEPHTHLRAKPEALTQDPYGQGWLFEGESGLNGKLLRGEEAANWMRGEVDRLSQYVHHHLSQAAPGVLNDGGTFAGNLLPQLSREEVLRLFHEFFPPYAAFPEVQA